MGPTFALEREASDRDGAGLNVSIPLELVYSAGGFIVAVLLLLALGFRRRRAVVHVQRTPGNMPTAAATRRAAPLLFPFRLPPPPSPRRVHLVQPTRVRLIGSGGDAVRGRVCRFCGLSLDEGEHATCQQGVLDG